MVENFRRALFEHHGGAARLGYTPRVSVAEGLARIVAVLGAGALQRRG